MTVRRQKAHRLFRALVVGLAAVFLTAGTTGGAAARIIPEQRAAGPAGLFTEATIIGTVNGTALSAYDAPDDFDPLGGYPAGIPDGSTADPVAFAGTIEIQDRNGTTALSYCIDLDVDTEVGIHYEFGEWSEANVPNLGYVEYILLNYFPVTAEPAGAANDNQRAAAVQAAIWFFTDRLVLATDSPVRPFTEAIVADALANGPSPEPDEPELTVTPDFAYVPDTGEIAGPFRVTGDGPAVLETVGGVEVFTDPEGANRLQDGDEVEPGTDLWARSVSDERPQGFVLQRTQTVLVGNALLYDGSNPGFAEAQTLILAQEAELTVRAGAELVPYAAGGLRVTKSILGDGAGRQGEVVVEVDCVDQDPDTDLDQHHVLTFEAGTPAGDHERVITGIPAGSLCTVTETADGDNEFVDLVGEPMIEPGSVTIVAGETQDVSVTDTYARGSGSLQVVKRIIGPGAGKQGGIVIETECDDPSGMYDQIFTIEGGTPAGTYTAQAIEDIPAGTRCTVTETQTGENAHVLLPSGPRIEPVTTVITEGTAHTVTVTDKYVPKKKCDKHGGKCHK
ncbi:thioester domain-containing protein [Streptomyces sp. NPDC049879]|uniref:thioester domain-containing protein n=1 Tax=Streptomyces sp. NPDC049879 TaxID=3365598 RepID=UPI00378AB9F0